MEVTPLPEPRDIDWGELETLDQEHGEKSDRMNAGRLIKLCVWFGYSAIVAVFAVNWEALCKRIRHRRRQPTDNALLWDLLAGFVPAYFQDWLFDYVAVILYNTNRMFNSLWSESSLQAVRRAGLLDLLLDRRVRRVPALRHLGRHLERGLVLRGRVRRRRG